MLFEQRTACPEVSSTWIPIRDQFLAGKTRDAWKAANDCGFAKSAVAAEDWVLLVELARAVGNHAKAAALARLGFRHFPENFALQIFIARIYMVRGRFGKAIEFLTGLEGSIAAENEAMRTAELASVFADAELDDSASKCIAKVEAMGSETASDPLLQYIISCAYQSMRKWEKAVEHGQIALSLAPGWMRARGFLIHCLLGLGRAQEAVQIWEEGINDIGAEEASFEIVGSIISFSMGQLDKAAIGLKQFLERWPEGENSDIATCTLFVILVELGCFDEARNLREESTEKQKRLFEGMPELPSDPRISGEKHTLISLPIGSQNKNHCVPTAVAMATSAQGTPLDPSRMFEEMHGREGTALWRMREWLHQHGFTVIPINLDADAIKGLIDLGIPLMGALEGPFNAHVDLICGYNETLGAFYLRDPSFWAPGFGSFESILERYQMHSGVYAIIAEGNAPAISVAEAARSREATALLNLAEAVASANRTGAESAAAEIADSSPAAFLRDSMGVRVTISPRHFQQRCEVIGADETAPPVARFRSLISIDGNENRERLDKVLESQADLLGQFGRRYVYLLQAMSDGDWPTALTIVDRLLFSLSTVAQIWAIKSDVLAEIGRTQESEKCLQRAIELMPRAVWLREKLLRQNEKRLTFAEFLGEIDLLIEEDPDQTSMLWARALALQEGPDGEEFEKAVKLYTKYYPRDPNGYLIYAGWLNGQGRNDLARIQISQGRELLDEEDLPDPFDEEKDETPPQAPDTLSGGNADATEKIPDVVPISNSPSQDLNLPQTSAAKVSAEDELPDDREEVIRIAAALRNPLQPKAMAELERLAENGALQWFDHARLVVCRIVQAEGGGGQPPTSDQIDSLLPESPPGARHWFATAVADILGELPMRPALAGSLGSWIERIVPDFKSHAPLWFERIVLTERMGNMEEAIVAWEEYLQLHHSDASAYFRLGDIKGMQADYPAADGHFCKALEISPGMPGALQSRLQCARILGDTQTEREVVNSLRKKYPYQVSFLADKALDVAETSGDYDLNLLLENAASHFSESQLKLVRAQVSMDTGRMDEAASIIGGIDPENLADPEFESWLGMSMQVALEAEKPENVVHLCDKGLARWPDSTKLRQIRAEQIADGNPQQALGEFKEILAGDDPTPTAAYFYLVLGDLKKAFERAREFVDSAEDRKQLQIADCFGEAFSDPQLLPQSLRFSQWCAKTFPDSPIFRSNYALRLHSQGRQKEAVTTAQKLYEDFPDEPEWEYVLGRILIDSNPKGALSHLKKAYEKNKSSSYLFDLARCHQILANSIEAKRCHWEVLAQNPLAAASIANLLILGETPQNLWKYVNSALEKGAGVDDEYFLVIAVKVAKAVKSTVSMAWLPAAIRRLQVLDTQPGFKDEKSRLMRAVSAWSTARPADIPGFRPGVFQWLLCRIWPGLKWIPRG